MTLLVLWVAPVVVVAGFAIVAFFDELRWLNELRMLRASMQYRRSVRRCYRAIERSRVALGAQLAPVFEDMVLKLRALLEEHDGGST